ncbi:MAG: manganese efflux pump MntP family protein [Desulfobacterales bacterium]|jgi:putative Mn2+ efflux pump MntP
MKLINIISIAVALSMDAFAVSVASGAKLKKVSTRQTFRLSWHFGLFQAMMPVIGWSAGLSVRTLIESYDHWVAFGLLAFVGIHMIREALRPRIPDEAEKDPTKGITLVMLSVATSIDALAIGFGLSMLNLNIWISAIIIGLVAGLVTMVGIHLGEKLGSVSLLSRCSGIVGGIILLAIGVNILREHSALPFLSYYMGF